MGKGTRSLILGDQTELLVTRAESCRQFSVSGRHGADKAIMGVQLEVRRFLVLRMGMRRVRHW